MRAFRVAGLDLSTAATAVAATHDPRGEPLLTVYTIPGTGGQPLHNQINTITGHVRRACGSPDGRPAGLPPDFVIIEGTFMRMAGSDYPLHALHANVKQWLWERRIPYLDISPATLKVWATGSGSSRGVSKVTKQQVVEAIIATYGTYLTINPRDDNQADAVALLTLGLALCGQPLAPIPSLNHARALKDLKLPTLL